IQVTGAIETEGGNRFARQTALKIDHHRTVDERSGQRTDCGDGNRTEGRKRARLVLAAHIAPDVASLAVAGGENPTERLVVASQGIGLVYEHCGLMPSDDAKQCARRDAVSAQWL